MNRNQPDTSLPKTPAIIQYIARLNQLGTAAPTANVLKNPEDLSITWTRDSTGIYYGTINNYSTFTEFSLTLCASVTIPNTTPGKQTNVTTSDNIIIITTNDYVGGYADGGLSQATVELKIYVNLAKFY